MNDKPTEPRRSRARHVRTLPEQIADDIGASIARGDYAEGARLIELDLAAHYQVSRGPVREALRLLAQRGLADILPRRGAYVTGVDLDALVDLFNIRAVFMGLAARYFALMADARARADLSGALAKLDASAKAGDAAVEFQKRTTIVGLIIAAGCGSNALTRAVEHQNHSSAYGSLYQSGRADFTTQARRIESNADYQRLGAAIVARDGERAEAIMRGMIMASREHVIAALALARGQSFDSRRLLQA